MSKMPDGSHAVRPKNAISSQSPPTKEELKSRFKDSHHVKTKSGGKRTVRAVLEEVLITLCRSCYNYLV